MDDAAINIGCLINTKIKDSSDMNAINFSNTSNVNFIKTFYIATLSDIKQYKLTNNKINLNQ